MTEQATHTDLAAENTALRAEIDRLHDARWRRELEVLELLRTAREMNTARATDAPLVVRWDRTVIHPAPDSDDDTVVCCAATDDGHPVALMLDAELRDALAGVLANEDADL